MQIKLPRVSYALAVNRKPVGKLSALSPDALMYIVSFLPGADLAVLNRCNKYWWKHVSMSLTKQTSPGLAVLSSAQLTASFPIRLADRLLLRTKVLTTLHIDSLNLRHFPWHCLAHCSSLRHVLFDNISVGGYEQICILNALSSCIGLQNLGIRHAWSAFPPIGAWSNALALATENLGWSKLHTLQLSFEDPSLDADVQKLLFSRCPMLKTLQYDGEHCDVVAECLPNLENLVVTRIIPPLALLTCKNLRKLEVLSHSSISDKVSCFPSSLTHLGLYVTHLGSFTAESLYDLRRLEVVDISVPALSTAFMTSLLGCSYLIELRVSSCALEPLPLFALLSRTSSPCLPLLRQFQLVVKCLYDEPLCQYCVVRTVRRCGGIKALELLHSKRPTIEFSFSRCERLNYDTAISAVAAHSADSAHPVHSTQPAQHLMKPGRVLRVKHSRLIRSVVNKAHAFPMHIRL